MKFLHIDSSPLGSNSVSRQLTAHAVGALKTAHPEAQIDYLDLVEHAPSHLNLNSLGFRLGTTAADLTPVQREENDISERLVQQFIDANVVVIGAPMYNFSVPTQLKAWMDRIAQAGRTFQYTAEGPKGLAGGKTVIVVSTRGGFYFGKPHEPMMDHQEAYLKGFFGFLGITDIRIVRAEGLGTGESAKAEAIANAETSLASAVNI